MSTKSRILVTAIRTTLVAAAMSVAALWPMPDAAAADACGKLTIAEVAQACKSGGKKAVTKMMKQVVKEQNAAGNSVTCESCHKDLTSFARKGNAVADLKKYLAAKKK